MGRLSSVTDADGHGADYTYDRDSRLVKTEYTSGASEETTYNAAGYVTRLVNKAADGSVISEYAYTYYVTGSPATKTDASGTTTYTYDGQNRLKTAVYSDGTKDVYTFDDSGNRLTKTFTDEEGAVTVTEYEYDAANRLIASTEGDAETVYTYDDCGNLLSKTTEDETVEQSYDLLGRMISYTDGITEAAYDYYTSNMRRSKTVDGETTVHVWIGDDIAADMGENSAAYVQGVRLVWSDYGYYLYNAHGDVVQLVDADCEVIRAYDYDAFGIEKAAETEDAGTEEPDLNPYRYSGEYTDLESGYSYLRARYYDPELGRFITADNHWNVGNMLYGDDPIKFGGVYIPAIAAMLQSGNLYVYCMNNPLLYEDEGGEFIHLVIGAAVGAVVSAGISVATQAIAGEKISWSHVGLAAVGGAFSGGLAASGIGLVGQVIGNGLIAGAEDIGEQVIENGGFHDISASRVVKKTIIGAAGGAIGGKGASYGNSAGIMSSGKQLIKQGFTKRAWTYYGKTAHQQGGDFVLNVLKKSFEKSIPWILGTNIAMALKPERQVTVYG